MKNNLIQIILIYFICMIAILIINPPELYKEDNLTLKTIEDIDLENFDTYFNINIISIIFACFSYFIMCE